MKKLFTYLMLWLTALFAGTDFIPAGSVPYSGDYYNGSDHSETDYQQLYSSYVDGQNDKTKTCRTGLRYTEDSSVYVPKGPSGYMWFIYSQEENQSFPTDSTLMDTKDEVLLGCTEGQIIVAPAYCTVITDAGVSDQGTYMQVVVGEDKYTITFTNLERWFCCLERAADEKGEKGFTHQSNAKGVTLDQGCILGVATDNTTVRIQKGTGSYGEVISLNEFYGIN